MHIQIAITALAALLTATLTLAQTLIPKPTGIPSSNATLPQLVEEIPSCAHSCLKQALDSLSECDSKTDLGCACDVNHTDAFVKTAGLCFGLSSKCDLTELSKLTMKICARARDSHTQKSELQQGSNALEKLLNQSGTSTGSASGAHATGAGGMVKGEAVSRMRGDAMGAVGVMIGFAVWAL